MTFEDDERRVNLKVVGGGVPFSGTYLPLPFAFVLMAVCALLGYVLGRVS